jgi:hypothetical protein
MVSRTDDSSQMINTLRNCRPISTNTFRQSEASTPVYTLDGHREHMNLAAEGNTR